MTLPFPCIFFFLPWNFASQETFGYGELGVMSTIMKRTSQSQSDAAHLNSHGQSCREEVGRASLGAAVKKELFSYNCKHLSLKH